MEMQTPPGTPWRRITTDYRRTCRGRQGVSLDNFVEISHEDRSAVIVGTTRGSVRMGKTFRSLLIC